MSDRFQYPHLSILLLSWLICLVMIPWIVQLCRRINWMNQPGSEKHHAQKDPIPFLGGVAVLTAFMVAALWPKDFSSLKDMASASEYFFVSEYRKLFGIVLGGGVLWLLGLIDDLRGINAIIKLFFIVLVGVLLEKFGIHLTLFDQNWLNFLISIFWIAGVTSACNSLDHVDGAVGGTSSIAAFFTFLIAWYSVPPQPWLSYVAVALLGTCLGFLQYNFHPAKIYLGDNGSFLIGFVLAAMTILGGWDRDPVKAILIPPLLLVVPIYDIILSTVLRVRAGVVSDIKSAILYCGLDHTTHRLMALGCSKVKAVFVLYMISLVGGLVALSTLWLNRWSFCACVLAFLIYLIRLGLVLEQAKVYKPEDMPDKIS